MELLAQQCSAHLKHYSRAHKWCGKYLLSAKCFHLKILFCANPLNSLPHTKAAPVQLSQMEEHFFSPASRLLQMNVLLLSQTDEQQTKTFLLLSSFLLFSLSSSLLC